MIQASNISLSFGKKEVLKGLNLSMEPGKIHGIAGLNGAGKTTLFRLLFGLLKPNSGTLQDGSGPLSQSRISFLETDPFFYPRMTGREYLELLGMGKKDYDPEEWRAIFDLPLNERVDGYSTGMKKKLALLGSLALEKPILLLDEPFNGLDLESNEKVGILLRKLRSKGKTVIVSSHILETLTTSCDLIHYLENGLIQFSAGPDEFPGLRGRIFQEKGEILEASLDRLL